MVYIAQIWYILVYCSKKNLATLLRGFLAEKISACTTTRKEKRHFLLLKMNQETFSIRERERNHIWHWRSKQQQQKQKEKESTIKE
jgi:hypothetical protein